MPGPKNLEASYNLISAEEMPLFEQSIAESSSRLSPWLLEFSIHTVDREERWIRGNALPRRHPDGATVWTGILIDITEEKRAQKELGKSERRFQNLVDNIHDAIIVDDCQGCLVFANPRFRELFGMQGKDIRQVTLEDYVAPEWRAELRARHDRRLRGEQVPDHFEYEGLRADGTRIWIEVMVSTVVEDGRLVGTQSALRDVTDRKRMEEQNRQSQRLESVALLAGGVAHDFNNLLTVINGYSERLVRRMDPLDPLRNTAGEILRAGERAADLTRQLLAFSRMQPSSPENVDVKGLIGRDESLIRRLAGEDVEVSVHLDRRPLTVLADPAHVHQVLLNLVVNAREAMPDGGHLVIETALVEIHEDYESSHVGAGAGRFVCIEVSDTGVGMDRQTRERIFDPFFTTKGTGTGLGLATVHGLVKQQGGWIRVYSEPGRGTTFKIYLPIAGESGPAQEASPIPATPGRGTETILVVEDQPEVLRFAAETLEHFGYQVLQAASGKDALGVLQDYNGVVHLLLTDVVMPGMNGRELAEQVTRLRPNIRVLFMSGYGETVIAKHGVLDPGIQCLLKPFDADSLATTVRTVMLGEKGSV